MIPTDAEVKAKYIELMPKSFFNNISEELKATSGLTKAKDLDIDKFSNGIYRAFQSMTSSMKCSGVAVSGGGGAPGVWSGGTGTGGKLSFTFSMNIPDAFEAKMMKVKNGILNSAIKSAIEESLSSYTFSSMAFGSGTSTHTAQAPGTLTECKNVKGALSKIGSVSVKTKLEALDTAIKTELASQGFSITSYISDEVSSIKSLVKYLFNYYLDNTTVSEVTASGGVTLASAGTLSGATASGGTFK